jgi:hypothetical protein
MKHKTQLAATPTALLVPRLTRTTDSVLVTLSFKQSVRLRRHEAETLALVDGHLCLLAFTAVSSAKRSIPSSGVAISSL